MHIQRVSNGAFFFRKIPDKIDMLNRNRTFPGKNILSFLKDSFSKDTGGHDGLCSLFRNMHSGMLCFILETIFI